MNKYWSIFKISFQQEFAYRLNFIMWRVRNVIQILLVFFLWDTVFSDPERIVFGYDRGKILTYVFGILIIRAFVLSARAVDVAGQIANGELANYLIKPVSYFKYWLTRDLSSKALNLGFAAVEFSLLFLILKPPFFFQTNPLSILAFLVSIVLAILIFFTLLFITNSVPFWVPEVAWGAQFIVITIVTEFLSGALFPLDILPTVVQKALSYSPFPYLIFFPIQVYLGKIAGIEALKGIIISGFWVIILLFIMNAIWKRGIKVYQSYGR